MNTQTTTTITRQHAVDFLSAHGRDTDQRFVDHMFATMNDWGMTVAEIDRIIARQRVANQMDDIADYAASMTTGIPMF